MKKQEILQSQTNDSLKERLLPMLGKDIVIHRLNSFLEEPFYNDCFGVLESFEKSFIVVRRTDISDNGRPLYITFKYADFYLNDYSITLKETLD